MEGKELALSFHILYERLAPEYDYKTQKATKKFDENSANGKLMIAVCNELLPNLRARIKQLEVDLVDSQRQADEALRISEEWIENTSVDNVLKLRDKIKQLEDERRMYIEEKVFFKQQIEQLEGERAKTEDNFTVLYDEQQEEIKQLEELMTEAIIIRGPNDEDFIKRWQKALEDK